MKLFQLIALAVDDPSLEKQVFDRLLDSILFVYTPPETNRSEALAGSVQYSARRHDYLGLHG